MMGRAIVLRIGSTLTQDEVRTMLRFTRQNHGVGVLVFS